VGVVFRVLAMDCGLLVTNVVDKLHRACMRIDSVQADGRDLDWNREVVNETAGEEKLEQRKGAVWTIEGSKVGRPARPTNGRRSQIEV